MRTALFSSIAFLAFTTAAICQTPSPSPAYSESQDSTTIITQKPNETPRSLDEIKAAAKKNKTADDLIFAYDKFKDESVIMSKPENIVGSWEGALAIVGSSGPYSSGTPRITMVGLEIRFATRTLRETPDRYALVFDGMSPDWQFYKTGTTLYVLLDGDRRIELAAAAGDHDVKSSKRVDEKLAFVLNRDQLLTITSSKRVEIRIGDGKPREFKPKLIRRFRSLLYATRLEPEKVQ